MKERTSVKFYHYFSPLLPNQPIFSNLVLILLYLFIILIEYGQYNFYRFLYKKINGNLKWPLKPFHLLQLKSECSEAQFYLNGLNCI